MASFDVFLSHNSRDKEIVEQVARILRDRYSLRVWLDKWALTPGKPWQEELEEGLNESTAIAVFLGEAGFGKWENEEMRVAIDARVNDSSRRVIPVLLVRAPLEKLSLFLRRYTWVDLRKGLDDEEALYLLQCGIKGIAPDDISKLKGEISKPYSREMGKTVVSLFIREEIHDFNTTRQDALLSAIAGICNIPKGEIELQRIYSGSIVIEVRVPAESADYLFNLAAKCDINLVSLGIYKIRIEGETPNEIDIEEQLPEPLPLRPTDRINFAHNAIFTGRTDDLKALAKSLLYEPMTNRTTVLQAITCMIGIGKTQLAVEFCHRYGRYFEGVHWINAQQDIQAEIAACGAEMGLPYWPQTTEEQLQVTLHAWQKSGPRLLVLDCIENPEVLRAWLPRFGGFRILMTTRRHVWPPDLGLQIRRLDVLPRRESLSLLHKLAPRLIELPNTQLEAVAEQLGDLPLALDLAGRYLRERPNLTPQGYLKELNRAGGALKHSSLLDWVQSGSPTAHETNLTAAFLLSWKQLDKENPIDIAAIKLFSACGYCASNTPIPREILCHFLGDEQLTDRGTKRLHNLGLLTENTTIHPLLAEFARIQDGEKESLKAVADVLAELSYAANKTGLPAVFAPLRPHLEITARAAEDANILRADDLWGNLGCHLRIVAEFEEARKANRQALTIDEAVMGPDHTQTALRLNNLGRVLQVTGELDGAKQYYERALAIDQRALGSYHPTVALRHNNVGMILKDLGDLQKAKRQIQLALAIDLKVSGPDHPNVARDLNNLGWVLKDMYELDNALLAFQRTRAIDEAALGSNHPNVARDIKNMGWVLKDLGKFEDALEHFKQAYAIDKAALGPNHPAVAEDINNLGWVLKDLGKLEEALEHFEDARVIDQEAYSPNHPKVARDLNNIGFVLKDLGKVPSALETFDKVLAIYKKVYSFNHPEVANLFNGIGFLLKDIGRLEDARQYYEDALNIDQKVFGIEHLSVARDAFGLGVVLKALGDLEPAKHYIEWALAIYEKHLPTDHINIHAAVENLEILSNQIDSNSA
jgi:tetratricopeptide (TPR) repeat protein